MSGTEARVTVAWTGNGGFDGGREGGPKVHIDSTAATGPSPFDALLIGLGSCTCVDIVEILAKRRTPVSALSVEVVGTRWDGTPRRLVAATLHYRVDGAGIERVHAERAVELAVTKYCSVRDSLRADTPVEWQLTLNGSES